MELCYWNTWVCRIHFGNAVCFYLRINVRINVLGKHQIQQTHHTTHAGWTHLCEFRCVFLQENDCFCVVWEVIVAAKLLFGWISLVLVDLLLAEHDVTALGFIAVLLLDICEHWKLGGEGGWDFVLGTGILHGCGARGTPETLAPVKEHKTERRICEITPLTAWWDTRLFIVSCFDFCTVCYLFNGTRTKVAQYGRSAIVLFPPPPPPPRAPSHPLGN